MNPSALADILVVDDVPANLGLLVHILTGEGYKVRTASSGKVALRAAESRAPDLILMDIHMPEMNGYEVCQQLKQNAELKAIPIIFISAQSKLASKAKAFEVGGAEFLSKPFDTVEILARIRLHLKLYRTEQELKAAKQTIEQQARALLAAQE